MVLTHTAQREGRLSSFLLGELNMSAGLMNKLKWGDSIQVNGIPQRTNYPVNIGDTITVRLEEEAPEYPAEDGPLDILYEDEYLLVVDKPARMLIHPSRSKNDGTLANFVYGYYQKTGQKSAFHPMTRLDRDTYGIVLLAKNAHVHNLLQGVEIRKTYHALTLGWTGEDAGFIDAPIARRPLPSLLRYVCPEGKPSLTEYRVLEKHLSSRTSPQTGVAIPQNTVSLRTSPQTGVAIPRNTVSLRTSPQTGVAIPRNTVSFRASAHTGVGIPSKEVICKLSLRPITGRTHQLRLHCAYMGHPILGDPQYGNEQSIALSRELGISSQKLCAKRLEFAHPITGEKMILESGMDADIES